MDKKTEALRLALEALTHLQPTALTSFYTIGDRDKAITAIREAMAEHIEQHLEMVEQSTCKQALQVEQPAQQQEPVAWMFQHEETGRTMCVDAQQVEWDFEKSNPRLKKIAPLYKD